MLPLLSANNSGNRLPPLSKPSSNLSGGHSQNIMEAAYFSNTLFCEPSPTTLLSFEHLPGLCRRVFGAFGVSTIGNRLVNVLFGSNKVKVLWSPTNAHVANVSHLKLFRDFSVCPKVSKSVSVPPLKVNRCAAIHDPISVVFKVARPQPAIAKVFIFFRSWCGLESRPKVFGCRSYALHNFLSSLVVVAVRLQITTHRKLASFVSQLKTLFGRYAHCQKVYIEQDGGFEISVPNRGMFPAVEDSPRHVWIGCGGDIEAKVNQPMTGTRTHKIPKGRVPSCPWRKPSPITVLVTGWNWMRPISGAETLLKSVFNKFLHARHPDFLSLFRFEDGPKFSPVFLNIKVASARVVRMWFGFFHGNKSPIPSGVNRAGKAATEKDGCKFDLLLTIFAADSKPVLVTCSA